MSRWCSRTPTAPGASCSHGLDCVHLLDDPMSVVLPANHPLAARKAVRLERPGGRAWVGGCGGGVCSAMLVDACADAGFQPNIAFESDDHNVLVGLVAAGVGVALLPELACGLAPSGRRRSARVTGPAGAQDPCRGADRRLLLARDRGDDRGPAGSQPSASRAGSRRCRCLAANLSAMATADRRAGPLRPRGRGRVRDRDRRARQGRRRAPLPGRRHRGSRRTRALRAGLGPAASTARSCPGLPPAEP